MNIADRMVLEQHLQRPQAERLVEHFFDQPLALVAIEKCFFGVAEMLDDQSESRGAARPPAARRRSTSRAYRPACCEFGA